jgi:chemotaxis methyl-accepting protein methylase
MEQCTGRIRSLFWERYQKNASVFDESFFNASIRRRAEIRKSATLEDYAVLCSDEISESDSLLASLCVGYSEFFRTPLTFACLEQIVLPDLVEKKKRTGCREIRIWSAACSMGQEAFSLAILYDELLARNPCDIKCRIFATDSNPDFISLAQKAQYPDSSMGKVSLHRIRSNFSSHDGLYEIDDRLKTYVDFSEFDLLNSTYASPKPSIYGSFDIVLCCNMLFYYSKEWRQRILDRLATSLVSDGYLVTGEAEREMVSKHAFTEVFDRSALFKKGKAV